MRCHEARALSTVWHDSELDAKAAFDIQQHLDGCNACRAYFEGEHRADARVDAALRPGEKNAALWKRLESLVIPQSAVTRVVRTRWRLPVLAAAACVVLGLAIHFRPHPRLDLAEAAAVDHAKYVAGNMPAQFEEQPPEAQFAEAQGRLDRAAFSLLPPARLYQPEGRRMCFLKGVPVAWVLGRSADRPVSLIVMRREQLSSFPGIAHRLAEGRRIACSEAGGFQFAARAVGDHVVCAVADTPRAELEALVAAVSP